MKRLLLASLILMVATSGYAQTRPHWKDIRTKPVLDTTVSITVSTSTSDLGYSAMAIQEGAGFTIASGKVLTIDTPITAGEYQIFFGSGTVEVAPGTISEAKVEWWGAKPDDATDNTEEIQAAIFSAITGGFDLVFANGIYRVSDTIYIYGVSDANFVWPAMKNLTMRGTGESRIFAAAEKNMFSLGNETLNIPMQFSLHMENLILDAGGNNIRIIDGGIPLTGVWLGHQCRFYADKCQFINFVGEYSAGLSMEWSAAYLNKCIISGGYNGAGIGGHGITARVTMISLNDSLLTYCIKGINFKNFAETTVQAVNSNIMACSAYLSFEGGGYIANGSSFTGCFLGELHGTNKLIDVVDTTTFGSIGVLNFIDCQFDNYTATGSPLMDLDIGNVNAYVNISGCHYYGGTDDTSRAITVSQYVTMRYDGFGSFYTVGQGYPGNYLKVLDTREGKTPGGTSSAGNNVRVLNTSTISIGLTIPGASLATNTVTLPAGTYRVKATAPAFAAGAHRLTLYNVTGAVAAINGKNAYSVGGTASLAELSGQFSIATTTALQIHHYIASAATNIGLGFPVSPSTSTPEVYTEVEFWKVY